jgi:hypothetical protein
MTIVNTTDPGHVFYPGQVTMHVTPDATIEITGTGSGAHPWLNDIVGMLYFGLVPILTESGCNAENGAPYAGLND